MNRENPNSDDARLHELMREARVSPALPPRFREQVWRRIENVEAPVKPSGGFTWVDALATLLLRPRFAWATVTVLILAGAWLGAHQGAQIARHDAQARYVAVVAPNPLR